MNVLDERFIEVYWVWFHIYLTLLLIYIVFVDVLSVKMLLQWVTNMPILNILQNVYKPYLVTSDNRGKLHIAYIQELKLLLGWKKVLNTSIFWTPSHYQTNLNNHQQGPVVHNWVQFRRKCSIYLYLISVRRWPIEDCSRISLGQRI